MHNKVASVILNSGQKQNSASEIFVAQPDINKENLAGKLFIAIEIDDTETTVALKIINFIINNLNANYYQNEKILLREKINTLSIENIFETVLAKTNKTLEEFIFEEKLKIQPRNINATVGIIHENNLYFSAIGKNKALLLFKDEENKYAQKGLKKTIKGEYKIIDVDKDEKPAASIEKLFSSVISGSIPKNGYFLFTNEALPEYLSEKQLIEIVTKLPPMGAAEQIKNTLYEMYNPDAIHRQ